MQEKKRKISELEKQTKVNRRTIHFYTKKKLIPPPEGLGGGARYGEESYLRIKLIKELQKTHLKLAGVKDRLDAMTIEEMRDLVDKAEGSKPVSDKNALDNWLQGNVPNGSIIRDEKSVKGPPVSSMDNLSFLNIGTDQERISKREKSSIRDLKSLRRYQKRGLSETTWTRVIIADGIEVNIRSDIQKKHASIISKWIQDLKRKILKGDY